MRELSKMFHLNGHYRISFKRLLNGYNYLSSWRNWKSHNNVQIFMLLLPLLLLSFLLFFILRLINKFLKKNEPQYTVKICDHFFRDF